MWLLLSLALAADPAPAPTTGGAPAATGAAPVTVELRRTCDGAQLCDGRCIPWTERCASTVKESLAAVDRERHTAELGALVCGKRLGPPAPPPMDPTAEVALNIARSGVCSQAGMENDPACEDFVRPDSHHLTRDDIVRPHCGDPPVIAPAPADPAASAAAPGK